MNRNTRSYKVIKEDLDRVISELQDDNTDIDLVFELYKKGQALIKELELYIKSAENKIKEIKAKKFK